MPLPRLGELPRILHQPAETSRRLQLVFSPTPPGFLSATHVKLFEALAPELGGSSGNARHDRFPGERQLGQPWVDELLHHSL